jgi:hypothetical protein
VPLLPRVPLLPKALPLLPKASPLPKAFPTSVRGDVLAWHGMAWICFSCQIE